MEQQETAQFYVALINLLIMTKRTILKTAQKNDLTGIQATMLLMLQGQTPPTMQKLATTLACDASNITGIIDSLESKQLVSRHEKPGDRRVKVVQLEPAGSAMASLLLRDAARERSQSLASRLTAEEMHTLSLLVAKLGQPE